MDDEGIRRVVVTGAAGFIGSHVTSHLASSGAEVIAVDVDPGWRTNLREALDRQNVRFVPTPSRWPYELPTAALDGADAVVHLAYAEPSSERSELRQEINDNLGPSLDLLDRLPPSVRRVAFASTALVYGRSRVGPLSEELSPEPDSPYALAKVGVEQALEEWADNERRAVSLRFATVYGPAETVPRAIPNFIRSLLAGEAPVVAIADDARDYVHVSDVARAVERAVTSCGEGVDLVNVGTGVRTTTEEIARRCVDAVGVSIEPIIGAGHRPPVELVLATNRAREVLGFSAEIDLAAGLPGEVAWFRSRNQAPAGAAAC